MTPELNKINIKPWTTDTEINAVLSAITKGGKEARFVGGCVRDFILGEPVDDIDIATQEPPKRVIELLTDSGIKAIPIGINHGTITAIVKNKKFEITTLRRDIETDGRHAVVEYTDDWKKDAARRDFTINAISIDLEGNIFDYFTGRQDLASKVIRFVGDAPDRIKEDYLRILRYFRFIATLDLDVGDKRDIDACAENASNLSVLSAERLRSELFKILSSNMKKNIIPLMYHKGILCNIIPHIVTPDRLLELIRLETNHSINESNLPDPIRRLAALIETDIAGVAEITATLKLSKIERNRLTNLKSHTDQIRWDMTYNESQRVIYKRGAKEVIDLVFLNWADMIITSRKNITNFEEGWLSVISIAQQNIEKEIKFPIKGQDAINLGLLPGRKISQLLSQVEEWWLDNGCTANRKACLNKLKTFISVM
jgi:poly(A) polymerase